MAKSPNCGYSVLNECEQIKNSLSTKIDLKLFDSFIAVSLTLSLKDILSSIQFVSPINLT